MSLFLDPRDNTAAFAESASQEPLYRITPATAKDLAKGLFDLRGKQLIAAEPDQVRTLVIKTGGQEYSLSREGADWPGQDQGRQAPRRTERRRPGPLENGRLGRGCQGAANCFEVR